MTDKRPIDANALYEDVSRMGLTNGSTLGRHSGMADAIAQMIQDAPTIDPESLRPVAHWDMEEDAVGDPIIWTCSNCKDSIVMYDGAPMENGYKYCPMCGARMEDVTNEQAEIS